MYEAIIEIVKIFFGGLNINAILERYERLQRARIGAELIELIDVASEIVVTGRKILSLLQQRSEALERDGSSRHILSENQRQRLNIRTLQQRAQKSRWIGAAIDPAAYARLRGIFDEKGDALTRLRRILDDGFLPINGTICYEKSGRLRIGYEARIDLHNIGAEFSHSRLGAYLASGDGERRLDEMEQLISSLRDKANEICPLEDVVLELARRQHSRQPDQRSE